MIINNLVLHILDCNSSNCLLSERQIDLSSEEVYTFMEKHILKALADNGTSEGEFYADSEFAPELECYLDKDETFLDFSKNIANLVFKNIVNAAEKELVDLVVAEFLDEDVRKMGVFLFAGKPAFTHQVEKVDNVLCNEIIRHFAIFPNTSQRIDSFVIVNLLNGTLKYLDKKRSLDGKAQYLLPEKILGCSSVISPKESVKVVNKIAKEVAEEFGVSPTVAMSKAKVFIADNIEENESFSVEKLGQEVFEDSLESQVAFADKLKDAKIPDVVNADRSLAKKSIRTHKIKTDTGIEITFPADYAENNEFIEFVTKPDGMISIELKNIGKVIDR